MDSGQMHQVKEAGALLNLDSTGQLEAWWRLYPEEPVGIRCNIGDLVEPRSTRGGYFLGKQSRLGLTLSEIEGLFGSPRIAGLHLYVGTDLLDLGYSQEGYPPLARLARNFPALWFIDFGGGFGLPRDTDADFPLERYGSYVTELMTRLSDELDRPVRLILEPGRIIGGEAGYFVCRVTDVKQRNGSQLIGVNGSSVQFPRPLFYPDDAYHPVTLLGQNGQSPDAEQHLSSIYGCSTYSRDFFSRDLQLPPVQLDDLLVFGHAGSYCATAFTHFLGFPRPAELFV
jgi:diaminopimelate decarboxylase